MLDFLDIEIFEPIKLKGVLTSLFCGFIVGIERQISGKPAGIRTSSLICLGTMVFVAIARSVLQEAEGFGDYSRIIGQIVTGVGFLGAGVMLTRDGMVVGVTSAAVIWLLASIGCLIGVEKYLAAILIAGLTIFILVGVNIFERVFKKQLKRGVHSDFSQFDEKNLQK